MLANNIQKTIDSIYPVGALYLSMNNTNPSTLFGGTWKQLTADAYLKIVTSGASETAKGQTNHKIPVTSMPSHTHAEQSALGTNKFRVDANLNSSKASCVVRQAEGPQAFTETNNRNHGDSANRSSSEAADVFGLNLNHVHTINSTGGGKHTILDTLESMFGIVLHKHLLKGGVKC